MLGLHHLVTDWGGFEKLVAELHETGDFKVERNVVLDARDGGTYEIDVLLTSTTGPYEHKTLVSCKYWNSNVPRKEINDLIQARSQLRAQKAVCFTSSGFQDPSATAAARAEGIDLFVVRDLLPAEWGTPGRVITIVLQFLQVGVALSLSDPSSLSARDIDWLAGVDPSIVAVFRPNGDHDGTLGDRCSKLVAKAYSTIAGRKATYSGGVEGQWDFTVGLPAQFAGGPRILRYGEESMETERFHCTAVVRLYQSPIVIDRSKAFDFALVVEDFLNDRSHIVSRQPGERPIWAATKGAANAPPSMTASADAEAASSSASDPEVLSVDTLLAIALLARPLPPEAVAHVLACARSAAED